MVGPVGPAHSLRIDLRPEAATMPVGPWGVVGWFAFGLALTALADWLVARLVGEAWPGSLALVDLMVGLVWAGILVAAGLLAMRYLERMPWPGLGAVVFVLVVLGLSMMRAWLYRRAAAQRQPWPGWDAVLREVIHFLLYVLAALAVYLLLALLGRGWADPVLFVPLAIGALLPDLDAQTSPLGRLFPFLSRPLEEHLGHGGAWHTPAAAALVAALSAPLLFLIPPYAWWPLLLGFACHLAVDLFDGQGVMLLWPLSRARTRLGPGWLGMPEATHERWLAAVGVAVVALLLVAVDLGPPPAPAVVVPTYDQSLDRYHSLQGRNLALADVDGAWQTDGRRVKGRFEILNALGRSYVLLDRYTGRVFRAGREADDHLYLNRITVLAGPAVRIKPAEVHLEGQPLAEALPVLYQMQQEPGLEHIFVSGDVVLPSTPAGGAPALRAEYPQTRLPKIEGGEEGHYRLNYLTAAELIALGDVSVRAADLVVVATYTTPATGPTVTPLPPAGTPAAGHGAP